MSILDQPLIMNRVTSLKDSPKRAIETLIVESTMMFIMFYYDLSPSHVLTLH